MLPLLTSAFPIRIDIASSAALHGEFAANYFSMPGGID